MPEAFAKEVWLMTPIIIEVVAPMLSSVEMSCRGCSVIMDSLGLKKQDRQFCAEGYPEDWKEAVEQLKVWISEISRLYRHRILIRVIDAQTPVGLWKQIRHRVFKFPAFIVNKKKTYVGWNPRELESVIDAEVRRTS
jgi:hypothetical protein